MKHLAWAGVTKGDCWRKFSRSSRAAYWAAPTPVWGGTPWVQLKERVQPSKVAGPLAPKSPFFSKSRPPHPCFGVQWARATRVLLVGSPKRASIAVTARMTVNLSPHLKRMCFIAALLSQNRKGPVIRSDHQPWWPHRSHRLLAYQPPAARASAAPAPPAIATYGTHGPEPSPGLEGACEPSNRPAVAPTM